MAAAINSQVEYPASARAVKTSASRSNRQRPNSESVPMTSLMFALRVDTQLSITVVRTSPGAEIMFFDTGSVYRRK